MTQTHYDNIQCRPTLTTHLRRVNVRLSYHESSVWLLMDHQSPFIVLWQVKGIEGNRTHRFPLSM
jgi:hypothetical protein